MHKKVYARLKLVKNQKVLELVESKVLTCTACLEAISYPPKLFRCPHCDHHNCIDCSLMDKVAGEEKCRHCKRPHQYVAASDKQQLTLDAQTLTSVSSTKILCVCGTKYTLQNLGW